MTGERGAYDPLEPLVGFEARRRPTETQRTRENRRAGSNSPATRALVVVPFGTWDRQLVRYTVLLDRDLNERVATRLAVSGVPFGQLAFEAITEQFSTLRSELFPTSDIPFRHLRTHRPAPLPPGTPHVRRTSRLTIEQALAVQDIRERFGRIEIGQLHRFALALHLQTEGA